MALFAFDLFGIGENAYANGVKLNLLEVVGIEKNIDRYIVKTMDKCYQNESLLMLRASDLIHNLICNENENSSA
ncbi:MAG: hypothetical protein ACLRQF_08420 [Thomasclavelia ramosa]